MPNAPAQDTVTVSFTMPRELAAVVNSLAKRKMTNKSDIIRQALLNYIPKEEADAIVTTMMERPEPPPPPPPSAPVKYPKPKRRKNGA